MPGVTFDRISSNINSTIVIGYRENNTKIAGIKSFSTENLNRQHQISIPIRYLNRFPGPHTAYLIPRQRMNESSHAPGDLFPDDLKQGAIVSKTRDLYFSQIEFSDVEYNNSSIHELSVENVRLDDDNNGNTSYILTLHPVDQNNNILQSEPLV